MKPTLFSPWYVVVRYDPVYAEAIGTNAYVPEYYAANEGSLWSTDKGNAFIFQHLMSAAAVASASGAQIIVLPDEKSTEGFPHD